MRDYDAEIARIDDHLASLQRALRLINHLKARMENAEKRLDAIKAIIEEDADV